MGDVTISEQLLRDLIDKLGESAAAGMATANAVQISTVASEKRQESIVELLIEQNKSNAALAQGVEKNLGDKIEGVQTWWRKFFMLLGVALVLATLLGIPIGRIISAVFHIPLGH